MTQQAIETSTQANVTPRLLTVIATDNDETTTRQLGILRAQVEMVLLKCGTLLLNCVIGPLSRFPVASVAPTGSSWLDVQQPQIVSTRGKTVQPKRFPAAPLWRIAVRRCWTGPTAFRIAAPPNKTAALHR